MTTKSYSQTDVCPVELAGSLDNRFRRFFQNPKKILSPYIKEGMTALDVGCGPGFFTIDMAVLAGEKGFVIAADLQEGMLAKVKAKVAGTPLEKRIMLHLCENNRIGLKEKVDFVLLFYMVHEVPDKKMLLSEVYDLLNTGGHALIVEPPFHVSKKAFADTLQTALECGLTIESRPGMFPDKAALLSKN